MIESIKKASFGTALMAGALAVLPLPAHAISDFTGFINQLKIWLNDVVGILIGIALIVFIWGIVKFIGSGSDDGRAEGRKRMGWGIIGLFVIIAVWGIINFLSSSLNLTTTAPTAPTLPSLPVINSANLG